MISLREDYLGELDEFSLAIPNLFKERFRLKPLGDDAARVAITYPARVVAREGEEPFWAPLFEFDKAALDRMIEYLRGEFVIIELFTLQLLCRHAEAVAHNKGANSESLVRLSLADFNGRKDFDQVLRNFYQDALANLEVRVGLTARNNAEELCEHGLLDREGRRLLLEEGQIREAFGNGLAAVSEVAVIGVPHPHWVEAVVAVVAPKAGAALDEGQVLEHAHKVLASFKVPKRVVFTDALPKNPSGKILKRQLREAHRGAFG